MCDSILRQTIVETVSTFVATNKPFTAYDITAAVRSKTTDKVRHRDVREVVRDLYKQGNLPEDYVRQVGNVQGKQPWVYYPASVDLAGKYGIGSLSATQSPVIASTPDCAATGTTCSPKAQPPSFYASFRPDARGSVTVPAALVKKRGWKPGDIIKVVSDGSNGTHVIEPNTYRGEAKAFYRVNKHYNIRLTKKIVGTPHEVEIKETSYGVVVA